VEEEAKIVRLAFEQYATGRFSDIEIAEMLNQYGYKTRSGRRFSKDSISGILRNPFYSGMVVYNNKNEGVDEIYEGKHEALISPDLWERCQIWRRDRRTLSRAVQKKFNVYLLSNLATCDICGRKLRAQGSKTGKYYREMSYERGYTDCPHQRIGVRTEIVEKQIHALIPMINLPREWLDEVENRVGDDKETVDLQRQRDRLDAELRRLQQMRLAGDFDENMEFYREELARIKHQLNSLPTYDQLTTLRSTIRSIKNLYEIWDDAEPEDQRDLLRLMLREVRVDVRSGRITGISRWLYFSQFFDRFQFYTNTSLEHLLRSGLLSKSLKYYPLLC
jgi:site-specific DNA recombinase